MNWNSEVHVFAEGKRQLQTVVGILMTTSDGNLFSSEQTSEIFPENQFQQKKI
jgi:hypothetical protein